MRKLTGQIDALLWPSLQTLQPKSPATEATQKLQSLPARLSIRGEKQYPQRWGEYLHVLGDSR